VSYFNELELFPDEQNGFRQNRSCEDHIFAVTSIVRNRLANKKPTFCAFIDLEKAFDWVNRDLLLYKLLSYNVDGKIYKSIQSLFKETSSCIELINNVRSDWFNVSSGVRQGDPISPTLFSIFINDLVNHMKVNGPTLNMGNVDLNMLLYADDMVLLADSEIDLQVLLTELHSWCNKWRLKVNEQKSKIVHFRGNRQKYTHFNFKYADVFLEKVSVYKYLGIILDENMNFNSCTNTLAGSAGRALGGVISKFKALKNVRFETFTKLYESGVIPVAHYAAGVWGYVKGNGIDLVQNRAVRYYLGVHKRAPNAAIMAEMGWLNSKYHRYICMLRYWNKMLDMDENRLTRKIFEIDYLNCMNNWSYEVRTILEKIGLLNIFETKTKCNLELAGSKFKENMLATWHQEIRNKPKLRTYVKFKRNIETETYVKSFLGRQNRSLLAQFRIGILPLKIETGRFTNTPLDARICNLCNLNEIENEMHFLCSCPLYQISRNIMYNKAINNYPDFVNKTNEDKLVYLLECEWKGVADFLKTAWDIRCTSMYK
jgi:hypothetical protein